MDHQALFHFTPADIPLYGGFISLPSKKVFIHADVLENTVITGYERQDYLEINKTLYLDVDWLVKHKLPTHIMKFLTRINKSIPKQFSKDILEIRELHQELADLKRS